MEKVLLLFLPIFKTSPTMLLKTLNKSKIKLRISKSKSTLFVKI
ncbi:Uncharacterised protein [Vibrio cholerae]|nr:Uncharacterised protein [Vibrio cholerae]CSB74494.1 Uncharacterised protein [Vibrio cholerae]